MAALYADAEIRVREERLGLWRENNPTGDTVLNNRQYKPLI